MTLLGKFLAYDVWFMQNEDDPKQKIQGQFVAIDPTEDISMKYAMHGALGRQTPIIQFLSGDAIKTSFKVKLHGRDLFFTKKMKDDLAMLKSWTKIDSKYKRPPVLSFWIGNEIASMASCVITGLHGIKYGEPTVLGDLREVELTVNLMEYQAYSIEGEAQGETLYYRTKDSDYYEMMCQKEYGNPMLGDVIRKRNPDKQNVKRADIIKLPSIEIIRRETVEPKSHSLKTAFGKKDTVQRTNRINAFERTNREKVSHIVI